MLARLFAVLVATLFAATGIGSASLSKPPLPAWIAKAVAEKRAVNSLDVMEESTFHGVRVFEIVSGYRFDTGDEHVLYDESGKEICEFGGFVGQVTSGECDISKIVYVRTIYAPRK